MENTSPVTTSHCIISSSWSIYTRPPSRVVPQPLTPEPLLSCTTWNRWNHHPRDAEPQERSRLTRARLRDSRKL